MVTEDPAPGQAVTSTNPAASLVNVSTIRPDCEKIVFSYSLMGECAYMPALCVCMCVTEKGTGRELALYFHFCNKPLFHKSNKMKHEFVHE